MAFNEGTMQLQKFYELQKLWRQGYQGLRKMGVFF